MSTVTKYLLTWSPTIHYLLDEIEERLLAELRKNLTGEEADKADIEQAKRINAAVQSSEQEQQKSAPIPVPAEPNR